MLWNGVCACVLYDVLILCVCVLVLFLVSILGVDIYSGCELGMCVGMVSFVVVVV